MIPLILKEFYHLNHRVWYEYTDPRTEDAFLARNVGYPIAILAIYALVLWSIQKWMKDRAPFDLKRIMIAYNVLQVCLCLYVSVKLTHLVLHYNFSLYCEPIDYTVNEKTTETVFLVHLYYLIKIMDLMDTVFMVLRKKPLSFLHCYHHSGMIAASYIALRYLCGGHVIWAGVLNSYVHTVMYFYYLLCLLDKQYRKSVWWKKYLTQMQIVQFLLVNLLFTPMWFSSSCRFPKFVSVYTVVLCTIIMVLFLDFYYNEYIKKPSKSVKEQSAKKETKIRPESVMQDNS